MYTQETIKFKWSARCFEALSQYEEQQHSLVLLSRHEHNDWNGVYIPYFLASIVVGGLCCMYNIHSTSLVLWSFAVNFTKTPRQSYFLTYHIARFNQQYCGFKCAMRTLLQYITWLFNILFKPILLKLYRKINTNSL